MCILLRFLLLNEPLSLGVWKCEVQFSQCKEQLSQFYVQVLLLLEVLLLVLDLLGDPGDRFIWFFFLRGLVVFLCLAFFVSHPGSSALVTV